jgi:tetratricopeptide (TPR) repeat protein
VLFVQRGEDMGRFRQALIGGLFAAMVALPAELASADDRTDCHSGDAAKLTDPGFYETGVQACTRQIAAYSGTEKAWGYRSRSSWLRRLKRYDEALADVDRALSLRPKEVEIFDAQADIFYDEGDFDRAIAVYDQAIRIDPTYAAAYTSRGVLYEKKGDFEQARGNYRAALATPATRAGDTSGLQKWAHWMAETRLRDLKAAPTK